MCTDPEQREKEDNSELSEDDSSTANDEIDGNMDSSLLELFGITGMKNSTDLSFQNHIPKYLPSATLFITPW